MNIHENTTGVTFHKTHKRLIQLGIAHLKRMGSHRMKVEGLFWVSYPSHYIRPDISAMVGKKKVFVECTNSQQYSQVENKIEDYKPYCDELLIIATRRPTNSWLPKDNNERLTELIREGVNVIFEDELNAET